MTRALTTAQAAEALQCSERHVRNLITSGRLAASDISGGGHKPKWRITEQAIQDCLAASQRTAPQRRRHLRSVA